MEVTFLAFKLFIAVVGAGILLFNACFLHHMFTKSNSDFKDKVILSTAVGIFSLIPMYILFWVGTTL